MQIKWLKHETQNEQHEMSDSYLHNKVMKIEQFEMNFPSFSFSFNLEFLSKTRGWVNTQTLSKIDSK